MSTMELTRAEVVARRTKSSRRPRADRLYSGTDLLNHPEWGPCELIRGKVVPVCRPNYIHGKLMTEIASELRSHVKKNRLGSVISGDSGIYLERSPDTVRGPDVYFVSAAREPAKANQDKYLEVAPELCVEIVSPKDRWSNILSKVHMYLAIGVKIVWVIDPQTRVVQIYRQNKGVSMLEADGILCGEDVIPGFELPLKDLFGLLE